MNRSARAARAGLVLSCALFALALPRPNTRPEPCLQPALRVAGEVSCEPAGEGRPPLEEPPARLLEGPARRLFDLPIDPNRADAATLETLPGIGPARARAIIEERCRRPFASVDDLQRVRGLGPARVGALVPLLAIEGLLAACDVTSVKSAGCRSSCGNTRAELGPGTASAPPRPVEEGR
jgi:hypothetical protein